MSYSQAVQRAAWLSTKHPRGSCRVPHWSEKLSQSRTAHTIRSKQETSGTSFGSLLSWVTRSPLEGPKSFSIAWFNDHACGSLPWSFETHEEALNAAIDWKAEMVAIDDDPEAAEEEYSWKIIEEQS